MPGLWANVKLNWQKRKPVDKAAHRDVTMIDGFSPDPFPIIPTAWGYFHFNREMEQAGNVTTGNTFGLVTNLSIIKNLAQCKKCFYKWNKSVQMMI